MTLQSGVAKARLVSLILALTAIFILTGKSFAETPISSFACNSGNSTAERTICDDPKLALEDRLMSRLYSLARVSAFGRGPSNQLAAQRQWRKLLNECGPLGPKYRLECIRDLYAWRNEQLAVALLFTHPEVAFQVLQRLDPEAAPMFEAIYLYARHPRLAPAEGQRVIQLLQPYKDTPGGWGDPEDAVKSDAAFAEFIGVRSAGINNHDHGRFFPCAAVMRKPKLLEATSPRFGSTMDSHVIGSDCEDVLPPLPKFTALVAKRREGLTDCGGGTMRFAYYSAFANAAVAARVATGSQLSGKMPKPFPRRRNVTTADTGAALNELAAYYERYGRAKPGQSRALAQQMIYQMLDQAWQC